MSEDRDDIAVEFARCFAGSRGERVLAHLRGITIDRRVAPSITDAELRFLEGQRALVGMIQDLVNRGSGRGAVVHYTQGENHGSD
ncbi:hypothetical protein [Ferrovibrio sp.]|uniref:Bbp19 family protein n=1 Tax=Ferrovibrio sp. TaxID=1917215 RepID=UPI003D0DE03A